MLNSRGLGEQVQRKKEAYQSNPQALQQQYQQSQQLVDLLALQQLKSEKEAAARNMQMQMQQNPATIAQQREQEVLGMIKQEQGRKLGDVAQRTAGTLGQINKRTQQNMQRAAKQGLPSIGGPQRPPANAPQRPAMMAGGGIVAFQEGGVVSEEEIDEYLKNNPLEEYLPRKVIASKIRGQRRQELSLSERAEEATKRRTTPTTTTPAATSVAKPAASVTSVDRSGILGGTPNLQNVLQQQIDRQDAERKAAQQAIADRRATEEAQRPYGTALAQTLMKGPADRQIDFSDPQFQVEKDTAAQDKLMGLLEESYKTPEQIEQARVAASEEVDLATGRTEGIESLKRQEAELAAFDRQYSDPKKLKAQARMAGMLSAGAGPLARFGAGMFNTERQQEKALREALLGRQELARKRIDFTRLTGAEQIAAADRIRAEALADRRAVMTAYAGLSTAEQNRVEQETNRRVNIALGNQKANSSAEASYISMLSSLAQAEQSLIAIAEARQQLRTEKAEAVAALAESDPRYENVQRILASAEPDSDEYVEAIALANEIRVKAENDLARIAKTADSETIFDQLEEMIRGRASSSGVSSPQGAATITPDDILAVAPS
jgi:hypothetical protein